MNESIIVAIIGGLCTAIPSLIATIVVNQKTMAVNEWIIDYDNIYYVGEDGKKRTGTQTIDGTEYHFDEDGLMQRGWIKDETGWKIYNLDSNGRMRYSTWINADAQPEIGMPAGMYNLCPDGAVQMNGWAESVTPGIYWYVRPNDGYFDINNPDCWSTKKLW